MFDAFAAQSINNFLVRAMALLKVRMRFKKSDFIAVRLHHQLISVGNKIWIARQLCNVNVKYPVSMEHITGAALFSAVIKLLVD